MVFQSLFRLSGKIADIPQLGVAEHDTIVAAVFLGQEFIDFKS